MGAYIEAKLIESEAYLSLTGMASKVLLLFMLKRQFEKVTVGKRGKGEKKICINHESLTLTYVEVQKKYGITQPDFKTRNLTERISEIKQLL